MTGSAPYVTQSGISEARVVCLSFRATTCEARVVCLSFRATISKARIGREESGSRPPCHSERRKAKQESLAKGLGVKHVSFRATTYEARVVCLSFRATTIVARVGREESGSDSCVSIRFLANLQTLCRDCNLGKSDEIFNK